MNTCLICGAEAGQLCLLKVHDQDLELQALRTHAAQLDANWAAVHENAMQAFRGALDLPDASIPEMLKAIHDQSWALGSEQEHQLHVAWRQGFDAALNGIDRDRNPHLSPESDPPPKVLGIYTDHTYYLVAYSAEDAMQVVIEADMGEYDEAFIERLWRLTRETPISLKTWAEGAHAGEIAPSDSPDQNVTVTTMLAGEWIAREGRGFLATTES